MFEWLKRLIQKDYYQRKLEMNIRLWTLHLRDHKGTDCYTFTTRLDANPRFHKYGENHTRNYYYNLALDAFTRMRDNGRLKEFKLTESSDYIRCYYRFPTKSGTLHHHYISLAYFDVVDFAVEMDAIMDFSRVTKRNVRFGYLSTRYF